jgi:HicB family
MTTFPLRLPDDLKAIATEQAARLGISLNQYITTTLAVRVGAQAEAESFFAARARRAPRGSAKELLAKMGLREEPREGDRIED